MKVVREVHLVEEDCISCDVVFAMPQRLEQKLRETGETFYCPRGHSMVYRDSDNARLRKQVDALQSKLTHSEDQRAATLRELEQTRDAAVRVRHRAANGVCPCCRRTFANVARHMKSQHPDYVGGRQ